MPAFSSAALATNKTFLVGFLVADAVALIATIGPRRIMGGLASFWERLFTWEGKGLVHSFDLFSTDTRYPPDDPLGGPRWWPHQEHVHLWPEIAPWWVIRLVEPVRIRLCELHRDRAAAGTKHPLDPAPGRTRLRVAPEPLETPPSEHHDAA